MALWTGLGQAASVAQLVGADVGGLVSMIMQAAQTARHHRKECEQLARRVFMIAELLPHIQDPEAAQPLAALGDTLREAHKLVMSCQGRRGVYLLVMARRQAERFREVQSKIDYNLILFPVISPIGLTRRLYKIYGKMDHPSVHLSYDVLKEITNDFSEERKIGSGTYGSVYKGVHKDGKMVAVKLLYDMPGLDDDQFKREFNNLTSLQHDNIVRLVGYCHEIRQEWVEYNGSKVLADKIHRALCFEYAHNGSLHENLFDEYNGHDWRTRYRIIKGICNGLKYLHEELKPPMYHLDIKPANVLLDENMLPRVADFGLSRLFGQDRTIKTKSFIGTLGYLPPEFIEQNVISNKFDIFSLGVVIIKIMTGPEGRSRCADMSPQGFSKLVHRNWRARLQGTSMYEVEPEPYHEQVKTCIEIALRCVVPDRHKRPSIKDIVDQMNVTETKIQLWILQKAQSFAYTITSLGRFKYSDLADVTEGFSNVNQIGEGDYAKVYKGSYIDEKGNQEMAVKKIKYATGEFWDFIVELQGIGGNRHINLVELKGWCYRRSRLNSIDFMGWFGQQKPQLCLVYELMPNGNLNDHLFNGEKILPWEKRYQIVKGIGSALRYLHHECYLPILHRNITPSNVLLDNDFNAKLAGFGQSRIASENDPTVLTTAIETSRYTDPGNKRDGEVEFSRETDVYSFGIVLLDIACIDMSSEEVWELYNPSATEHEVMVDVAGAKLGGVFDRTEMERVIVLGLRCSHRDKEQRPNLVDAMKFLEGGVELPAITEKSEIEHQEGASVTTEIEGKQVAEGASVTTEIEGKQVASAATEIEGEQGACAVTEIESQRGASAMTEIKEIEDGIVPL